jgi:hypothetical protein
VDDVEIVPFEAAHLKAIEVQGHQALVRPLLDNPLYVESLMTGPAYSAIENGVVIACAGLIIHWPGRAHAWTILSGDLNHNHRMLLIHRAVAGYLKECPIARIEAVVQCDFQAGHRWMRLLGFKREVERMERYMPDGGPAAGYALVRAI